MDDAAAVDGEADELRRMREFGLLGPFGPSFSIDGGPKVVTSEAALAFPGATVERVVLQTEREIKVPLLFLKSAGVEGKLPVVVAVSPAGKAAFLKERPREIAKLLERGVAVCLPDLRGTGETYPGDDRGWNSAATRHSSSELMLGGTMIGRQLHDLLFVSQWLRGRLDVDRTRVAVWGDSFAPVNAVDRNLQVPRGVDAWPHQSEPGGALLALLAGLYDDELAAVYSTGGLGEFRSVLTSQTVLIPHDALVPGISTTGDLADLAAALAPKPLRIARMVDELNRPLDEESANRTYARGRAAYHGRYAAWAQANFSIAVDENDSPADWIAAKLKRDN